MDLHDYFIFSNMTKRIVLCADDYGQTHAISQGIIKLIQMGRVTATSCMVNMPLWADHAKWLFPFYKQIDMGLHLNLTQGVPLSNAYKDIYHQFFPLNKLLRYALFHRLDPQAIEAECHAQIDCFADTLGFLPHFIDGHQHVHQFPVVRQALISVYEKRLRRQHAYIRLVNGKLKFKIKEVKKILISTTGTRALKRLLTVNHIPHNLSFAGSYAYNGSIPYDQLFPLFLQEISNKGLIMCHPALSGPVDGDSIGKARFVEYTYLVGGRFLKDCHERGVFLGKFR
jgi:predicted glycoside hydrolase/deacetylase ChbG (UPF0249 family)